MSIGPQKPKTFLLKREIVSNEQQKAEKPSNSYKDTLNLLKTDFGMRANATVREPELQKLWGQLGIDFQLGLKNNGPSFTLHDGPPYANGSLHMGHALNKVLKDIINKYQILKGRKVHFVPGWDCHGLPIELKVLQTLDTKQRKELTPLKLRTKAASFAKKQVQAQMVGFKRWGVWGDWEQPYLTLSKEYEASQIRVFGQMALKGYIYRGLKPVHWSPSSRTALAEAELEYPDGHQSSSAYVSFCAISLPEELRGALHNKGLDLPKDEYELSKILKIAIWTTTPWTLPANLAIAVNPKLLYSIVCDEDGTYFIVALDLLNIFRSKVNKHLKSILSIEGSYLEGIIYKHPFLARSSKVIIGGDYINTESGTGLVHTAPGHGVDDFNTGLKNGLDILCPVDEGGFLTSDAGQFAGLNVLKDANIAILEHLKESGNLLLEEKYNHRYPYDWRTKKPTIFRATEQWFASVDGFRKEALKAISDVKWMPSSGRNRIESMVKERGDWCISRQRTWGVPIPVFYEKNGNRVLLNAETIKHIEDLIGEYGADIWWKCNEVDLLPPSYSKEASQWSKGTDTMDVWFDSGSSWSSVINSNKNLTYPADLYLEGSDQHRGWFQSSLLTSVAVNQKAPYKQVLTHGFALDENGRKMSKSIGNVIDPLLIIEGGVNKKQQPAYGADVLRLWVSSVDYSSDVPIGNNILRQLSDVYRKVRNTARYLLGNLHDYDPSKDKISVNNLPLLDKWMLSRTSEVIDQMSEAYKNYEFSKFFTLLQSFCVADLSNFYLDIAKDRLYVSSASDFRRRSCQTVLSLIIENLSIAISPVVCHMAEDIWQNIPYEISEKSVFVRGWPKLSKSWSKPELVQNIDKLRVLRSFVNRVLEDCRSNNSIGSSLQAAVRIDFHDVGFAHAIDWINTYGDSDVDTFKDWLLVSELKIGGEPFSEVISNIENESLTIEVAKAKGKKCQRCWHYSNEVGSHNDYQDLCKRCIDIIGIK